MNWNAASFVYRSRVGAGNTPSTPRIGETSNRVKRTFKMILIVFIMFIIIHYQQWGGSGTLRIWLKLSKTLDSNVT